MSELQRGVVKWFNDAKGFGFIEHTSGRDVFVHYSVIETDGFKTLKDGEEVNYELLEGDKGLHASRVVRINAPKKEAQDAKRVSSLPATAIVPTGVNLPNAAEMIAPNLESGSVRSVLKTATQMIEVERTPSGSEDEDVLIAEESSEIDVDISDNG